MTKFLKKTASSCSIRSPVVFIVYHSILTQYQKVAGTPVVGHSSNGYDEQGGERFPRSWANDLKMASVSNPPDPYVNGNDPLG